MAQIVPVTLVIIVVLCKTGIHPCLESINVHRIGVKDILIDNFLIVPAFGDIDPVSIRFGILATT